MSKATESQRAIIKNVLEEAYKRPFYINHWNKIRNVQDLNDLVQADALSELPIVRKRDLRSHWQEVMDFTDAVDFVSSSGTTGQPFDIPLHRNEEAHRVALNCRVLTELGVGPGSRVLCLLSLNDLFSLGPIAWMSVKAVGGCAIRGSAPRIERLLQIFKYLQPKFVIGNPVVLARLPEEVGKDWPHPDQLPDFANFGGAASFDGECSPNPSARKVEQTWGLKMHLNQLGSSEIGPIGFECVHHTGFHIHDDSLVVELVDPHTNKVLTDPEMQGELVVTALNSQRGFLPVRYSTGDIHAWLRTEPCVCGRNSPRLGPVLGRIDNHLKVDGQTVYPDLLLNLADGVKLVRRSAVQVTRDALSGDVVTVLVLPETQADPNEVKMMVEDKLSRNFSARIQVQTIRESELAALEATWAKNTNQVKVPRFFDLRTRQG
jgi:phenylacetate-CoA ligase